LGKIFEDALTSPGSDKFYFLIEVLGQPGCG